VSEHSQIWFYHLERTSVEETLPPLLEKCLERGWRAIVRSTSPANLEVIDTHLWTYKAASWLPHGRSSGAASDDDRQPILLVPPFVDTADTALSAPALFLLDGADWSGVEGIERIFVLFDGRDEDAVTKARTDWRTAKDQGFAPAYWRQSEDGKWTRT
jgi:DNA polymerase III subunit chi